MRLSKWLKEVFPSYYDELEISSSATNDEIVASCSALTEDISRSEVSYKKSIDDVKSKIKTIEEKNKLEQDPWKVEQGSLDIHFLTERLKGLESGLETKVRTKDRLIQKANTLLDPKKRAEYDIKIKGEREEKLEELNQEWMKYLGGQVPESLCVLISKSELEVQPLTKEWLQEKISYVLSSYFIDVSNGQEWGDLIVVKEEDANKLVGRKIPGESQFNRGIFAVETDFLVKIKYRDPRSIDENPLKLEEIIEIRNSFGKDIKASILDKKDLNDEEKERLHTRYHS